MKLKTIFATLLIGLLSASCCEDDDNNGLVTDINCEALKEALLFDNDAVVAEINELCSHYPPEPTVDDEIGHEENLNAIIAELNIQCEGFVVELGCYACAESLPPQSTIHCTLDSAGVAVKRGIALYTPSDGVMYVH